MADTARFGISMDHGLLERFDKLVQRRGYQNRSEAIRDLIREKLVQEEWEEGQEVVGVVTLLFDHHQRNLSDELTESQHQEPELVIATTHIHLDRDNCLEMIAVKGRPEEVRDLASALIGIKGVKHGELTATSTGSNLH
ncbi:MAG: nickel-responsive transcriptional regulator NikR [Candidatus Bipolaricaulota bacterium]